MNPFGDVTGNGQGTRWLHQPENFVVVKGQGLYDRWHEALPDQPSPPSAGTGAVRVPGNLPTVISVRGNIRRSLWRA